MYAALFEVSSWIGIEQHIVSANSVSWLLYNFERIQSLSCLIRMGRVEENAEGQKMLDKLESILEKRDDDKLTIEDLLLFDITLRIGSIKCVEIAEGNDAAERLKAKYPNAK